MTSFTIDTGDSRPGYGKIDYVQAILDAAQDAVSADATQEEIDASLAKLIVMDIVAPKTAKTARMHFARYWPLINGLAPASYDHVLQEYAERLAELR